MAMARDPITCHVLDTTTGRPGADIFVRLKSPVDTPIVFEASTNEDGRITNWKWHEKGGSGDGAGELIARLGGVSQTIQYLIAGSAAGPGNTFCPEGTSMWKLEFDTGGYYGIGNTFFPQVELTFFVKAGEHFHVPLLLGPYSFTTYRGS